MSDDEHYSDDAEMEGGEEREGMMGAVAAGGGGGHGGVPEPVATAPVEAEAEAEPEAVGVSDSAPEPMITHSDAGVTTADGETRRVPSKPETETEERDGQPSRPSSKEGGLDEEMIARAKMQQLRKAQRKKRLALAKKHREEQQQQPQQEEEEERHAPEQPADAVRGAPFRRMRSRYKPPPRAAIPIKHKREQCSPRSAVAENVPQHLSPSQLQGGVVGAGVSSAGAAAPEERIRHRGSRLPAAARQRRRRSPGENDEINGAHRGSPPPLQSRDDASDHAPAPTRLPFLRKGAGAAPVPLVPSKPDVGPDDAEGDPMPRRKRPLYERLEQEFHQKESKAEEERRRSALADRRRRYAMPSRAELDAHARKLQVQNEFHDEQLKQRQDDMKRQWRGDHRQRHRAPSKYQDLVRQEEAERRRVQQEAEKHKQDLVNKRRHYGNLVREVFVPNSMHQPHHPRSRAPSHQSNNQALLLPPVDHHGAPLPGAHRHRAAGGDPPTHMLSPRDLTQDQGAPEWVRDYLLEHAGMVAQLESKYLTAFEEAFDAGDDDI